MNVAPTPALFTTMSRRPIYTTFRIHGTWLALEEAKRSGRKVVVISTSSQQGSVCNPMPVYTAAKTGVVGFMASCAGWIEQEKAAGVPYPPGIRFGSV